MEAKCMYYVIYIDYYMYLHKSKGIVTTLMNTPFATCVTRWNERYICMNMYMY